MAKIAFLGMGVMGAPMAGHLAQAGHEVTVFNRTAEKAQNWVKTYGGHSALTPAEAAKGAEFVFACVGNDDDIKAVALGEDGAFSTLEKGAIFIDNTTASADVARQLYEEAKARGIGFLDAPVSGGQAGAENGKLTVMVGGDDADFEKAEPLMKCYGAKVTLMGGPGSGQLTKMVNQICIAGLVQGLSEALNFGQKADLDMAQVLMLSLVVRRKAGRWSIAAIPWSKVRLILVLRLIGCAKIWLFVLPRHSVMAPHCQSLR